MKTSLVLLLVLMCESECHRMPFFLKRKSCLSHDCISNLGSSVNKLDRPCVNFYEHVCKQWKSEHKKPDSEPFWNQYSVTRGVIYSRIKHLLETEDNIDNFKQFYEVCMKGENADYSAEFSILIAMLGGWSDKTSKFDHYNYLEHIVEATKSLNVNPILKFHVDTDSKNYSRSALYIVPGSYVFPEIFLTDPESHPNQLKVYREWIEKTLQAAFTNTTFHDFKETSNEVVDFEIKLAHIAAKKDEKKKVSIQHLSTIFGSKFSNVPHFLFENTHVDYDGVSHVITHPEYLHTLNTFILKTNPRIVSNYIVWSGIKDIARAVSPKLRFINFEVDRAILGVGEDLPRSEECIQNGLDFFSLELAGPYAGSYFDLKSIAKVRYMAKRIKQEFIQMLEDVTWLSGQAKYYMIKKVAAVKFDIGFSNNVIDSSFLNVHFPKDYFITMLKMKGLKSLININSLQSVKLRWPSHIFEVNAFYNVLQNTIILPLGILHPPFYDPNSDNASNYAALGVLIGHELSHSLDSLTTLKTSWTPNDLKHYNMRTACFKKQYTYLGIDGSYTINENIADNVGIRASYNALQSLQEFTSNQRQTFFINFGQMWCEVNNGEENLLMLEEHAPVEFRVFGVLQNFEEFKNTFGCRHLNSFNCNMW